MKKWKAKEILFVKKNLQTYSDKEFSEMFGVTTKAFSSMRNRYKIKRPKYHYNFRRGHRPWNKGIHFYAGGRSIETQFKKKVA